MKLGLKIGLGFAALLTIAATLGILAIVNMSNVQTKSVMLEQEYVPEVAIANQIERSSFRTMYAMRGYGLTAEKSFLDNARENLQALHERLNKAKDLGDKSPNLKALKPAVEKVEKAVAEYERLTEETVSTNQKMDEQRHQLDAAAKQYMDNCTILLTGQNQKIIAEIQAGKEVSALTERLEKITLINDIIDTGNLTRIAAWRSQAAREPKIIQDANANFEIMQDKFSAMRRIIRSPEDIKNLNNVEEAAKEYKTAMNGFLALWLNNEELAKKRTEVGNIVTAESMKYPSPAWTAPPESPQKRSNR